MSKSYMPGIWSHQYEALPPAEKAVMAGEVDGIFRKQTGVTRALDPDRDRELVRTWLRIRDDLMARRSAGSGARASRVPGPRASGGSLITGSVGIGGFNYEGDVALVKTLLNEVKSSLIYDPKELGEVLPDGTIALRIVSLAPNGEVTPTLIDHIRRFQRRAVGMADPDGLVEPDGKTIRELTRHFLLSGSLLRLKDKDVEARLHPDSVHTIRGGPPMLDGLQFRRGQVINGLDGKRLLLSITAQEAVFMLLDRSGPGGKMEDLDPMRGAIGGFYAQSTDAFVGEYETFFWRDLSKKLAPIQTMIEVEVNLLMAIGTAMTGTAIFYAGFTLSDFIARNRHKFTHWIAIVGAVLDAREDLQRLAPTLYDNLFDALFSFYLRSLKPGNVSKVVGAILGKGGERLVRGKINVLLSAITLILGVVVALLQNIADSLSRAESIYNQGMRTLVADLRDQGVTVTPREQAAIFDEIRAHPQEIRDVFTRLHTKVDEHARLAQ
ncbi:hypothetical protein [Tautonia plasticadhaerens]|uniref:Uncharacterized protein n=1 Tax=Tautonia plasticadhaerens TaxID=2527974 RepID=A0A518H2N2_9BACT|nr:hypothetical protein [Tautonia plasticadhaerens]QDV35073.1 hypothetical protein ElP_29750 [Tautonia plasticadhaerens]